MNLARVALLPISLFAFLPLSGLGQSADTLSVLEPRSALLSGAMEWIVPMAGYAYAGDWRRGLLPNAVRAAGFIGILGGWGGGGDGAAWAAVLVWGGGTVWAVAGAAYAASQRTAGLRPALSRIEVSPSPGGGVSIGYRLSP